MECNKEEAIRAKSIAEDKMLNKDFIGARKIVLKAQQLYPDLENVAQMLTVCEVHCSTEVKVNGEMDWYGILQVVPTADELTIKKQYRKLALLLHPDKNKFGGAEGAFKLVGEAHRTLTDRSKRVLHDMKRGASFRAVSARQPAPHSKKTSFTKKQPGFASSFPNSTSEFNGFNQQQAAPFSSNQTFWTLCPSCGIRYQYYQNIMNRALRCQSCKKPFIAYDMNAHAVPSAASWNRTGIPQQEKPVPAAHFAGQKSNFGIGSGIGSQGNVGGSSAASQPWSNTEFEGASNNDSKEGVQVNLDGGTANDVKFEKVKLQEVNKREQTVKTSAGNRSQKRGRKIVLESSESESSDSDVVVEDGYPSEQNTGTTSSHPRRSTRQKQNISYNEDGSDDDFVHPKHKKSRTGSASEQNDPNDVNVQISEPAVSTGRKDRKGEGGVSYASSANGLHKREQGRSGGKEQGLNAGSSSKASASVDFSSEASPDDPEGYTYPDPEFYDFEGLRVENKFAVDQIWAMYDQLDAMPRYYALIRHVYGPKFKVRFNWLEYDPTGKGETIWFNGGLPIGCGSFKLGRSGHTQERLMFSHPMPWRKGAKKNTFDIFPRKSEVWALFKNWDIEWSSCVDSGRQYEYEIIEVMSDFTEGDVISVVRLVKVQGFVSLFVQAIDKESSSIKIQMKDVLQFSHKIPSYRLKGNEREGIPKGSLELDCASLPLNFAEMFPSISLESFKVKDKDMNNEYNGLHFKSADSEDEVPTCAANKSTSELNRVAVELRRSQDTFGNKGNDACKDEPKSSGMTKHAAVGSQQHIESDKTTCKEKVGAKENINSRDPNTCSAAKNHTNSQQSGSPHSPHWYEYPDSEFHNFEEERSSDKFEEGQIWALYSDMDKNPNYYGQITKVESEKKFRVNVTWLEGCSEQEQERFWFEEQLPVGCGTFKVIRDSQSCILDTTDTFSHLVHANPATRENHYVIYPRVGETWAVYKNWSLGWSLSNLENCEFDLVEILAVNSSGFKVMILSKVNGYRAVFMGERGGVSAKTVDIPLSERLKFSHKIPAFRLTEERGGKLRGYWELDPASVPDIFLFTNSN